MSGYGDVERLRHAFLAAGYTVDGVAELLGPVAGQALARHETVPARRATADGGPLATLVRLFLLQLPVALAPLAAAVPLDVARELGLVEVSGDEARAVLDVRPYAESGVTDAWWVVSDLGTGLDGRHVPLGPDHVLGVGGASTTLAQLTPRNPVPRTLDVGTGCGVQALHASRHSGTVVGTDLSRRAVHLAGLTAALSGVRLDLRRGDLLEPARGETFDLVVSNPPFVVGAPPGEVRTYRDSGLPLDTVGARLAADAPGLLTQGGTLVMLANWVHRAGEPWDERVAGWLPSSGVDALVVQREVLDPAAYVETWLRDAGERGGPDPTAYVERYDAWLAGLEAAAVEAVGFGFVAVRRTDEARRLTTLDWPHPVEQPLGPHVAAWLDRQRWLAAHEDDAALAAATVTLAPDVVQEQVGAPGAEDPEHVVLRAQTGLRRAFATDTATAALAGACDGRLPVCTLVAAVRQVLGEDEDAEGQDASLLARVRELVEAGVLRPELTAVGTMSAVRPGGPGAAGRAADDEDRQGRGSRA